MMNPPHLGHLAVVEAVFNACNLDRVVVVPCGIPPHRSAPVVSPRARLTMAVRAFADIEYVVVSDVEVERGERGELGYMVDTLDEIQQLPQLLGYEDLAVQLSLVIGADQVKSLPTWHRFDRIIQLAQIIVVRRPDQVDDCELNGAIKSLGEDWEITPVLVEMKPVPISSTLVRKIAKSEDKLKLTMVVPHAIIDDVAHLYGPLAKV